jgi:hypothetical protein
MRLASSIQTLRRRRLHIQTAQHVMLTGVHDLGPGTHRRSLARYRRARTAAEEDG